MAKGRDRRRLSATWAGRWRAGKPTAVVEGRIRRYHARFDLMSDTGDPTPGKIRVGIGGWTFAPWRGVFYPKGTRQADELNYASRRLTAIEINGAYYSSQKPETFAKWAADTPDDFVFSVKASRFCTNRRVLADAGESIERFFAQGIDQLGDKLGPILWQFMATKAFAAVFR